MNNAITFLIALGSLITLTFISAWALVLYAFQTLFKTIEDKREAALLQTKEPVYILKYLKFKRELDNWKDTKKEYKL